MVRRKPFDSGDMKHQSTEKYAYTMYAITVNLRKFQFLWEN